MHLRPALSQALANLRHAPVGELPLHPHNRLLHAARQLIGVAIRPAAAIREPLDAHQPIPLVNLVAGFPRDPTTPKARLAAEREELGTAKSYACPLIGDETVDGVAATHQGNRPACET